MEFVNGGRHRLAASPPRPDKSVTELAAGSGLVGPTLFDAYAKFHPQPALLYALPVVRRPKAGVATLFSGGYVASGTGTPDRLPSPFWPARAAADSRREGAACEVQTPVLGTAANGLRLGDRVWMRHAKAGELAERFDRVIEPGVECRPVPTYRGDGQCFQRAAQQADAAWVRRPAQPIHVAAWRPYSLMHTRRPDASGRADPHGYAAALAAARPSSGAGGLVAIGHNPIYQIETFLA